MTHHTQHLTSDTDEDSYQLGEGSQSPTQGLHRADRPRVRADGPGGQDLKRGARIACLECRSAKIRCSAPNDGLVPCKRCSRHEKECLFEKHRRGRKPGRGNLPKEMIAIDAGGSSRTAPFRTSSGDQPNSDISPASSSSYQSPGHWLPGSALGPKSTAPLYAYGAPLQSPTPFGSSPGMNLREPYRPDLSPYGVDDGRLSSIPRPGPSQPNRAYPGPFPHFPHRDQHVAYQPRQLQSPYDIPAPLVSSQGHGYQAPLSSASAHSSHANGFFSPPLARAEMPFTGLQHSSLPQRDEHRWIPNNSYNNNTTFRAPYSGARTLASERSPNRQGETKSQLPQTVMGPPTQIGRNGGTSSPRIKASADVQTIDHHSKLNQASTAQDAPRSEVGDNEEVVEDGLVDEEEVIGAYQNPDVLSRPLQLLAYASTAAARRQTAGGYKDTRGITAAATLGLISGSAGVKVKSTLEVAAQKAVVEPASLGAGGAEPSTLENGNWEYKAGRVRAIKGSDASDSPASVDDSLRTETVTAASTSTREEESQIMEDLGPHLGKRRRSDDEALPLPSSRRHSTIADQRRLSKLSGLDSRSTAFEASSDDKGEEPAEEQDRVAAGASRKGYFRFSLYASKLDIDDTNDPVSQGMLTLSEMEDLFDLFFNRINPSNFLFDPFLHSLAYVRARSKFLLTVIGSHAARMSEGARGAELAEKLEDHWRNKLLPEVLIGGYKSIEIGQAFLLASLFHRPTHIIVEDRAWQYLGFAIRTATEVGVNISLAPNSEAQDNEHLSRRLRNRDRLWLSLVIAEGTLSTQFGRPCTLLVKHSVSQSSWWNREDFALPEDAALMCQIELRRIVENHTSEFQRCVATVSPTLKNNKEKIQKLAALHKVAWQELESWKKAWCPTGGLDQAGVGGSMAMGAFLVRWSPYSRLIYYYWRSHLNSFILQATEKRDNVSSLVAFDSMQCARNLMAILLDENQIGDRALALAPNGVVVMATYAAVSALRLTKLDFSKHALIDQRTIFDQVNRLAESLEVAGKTPEHRDGAAAPYGTYLLSVLALFETDSKSSSSASIASEAAATSAPPLRRSTVEGDQAIGGGGDGESYNGRVLSGAADNKTTSATLGAQGVGEYTLATADSLAILNGAASSGATSEYAPSPQRRSAALGAGLGNVTSSTMAVGRDGNHHGGPNGDALAYALTVTQNAEAASTAALLRGTSVGGSNSAPLSHSHLSASGRGGGTTSIPAPHRMTVVNPTSSPYPGVSNATASHPQLDPPPPPPPAPAPAPMPGAGLAHAPSTSSSSLSHPNHPQHHHHYQHSHHQDQVEGLIMDEVALAGVYASDSEVWGYLGGGDGGGGGVGVGVGSGSGIGNGNGNGNGNGGDAVAAARNQAHALWASNAAATNWSGL